MTIIDQYAKELTPKYDPIASDYEPEGHGAAGQEQIYAWFGSFCQIAHEHFREGMIILDYGSGPCGLANYISMLLVDFAYIGLEPLSDYGRGRIDVAQAALGGDPRIHPGHIGGGLECLALEQADIITLGSVFTHLDYEEFQATMDKFLPCIRRGGVVTFSIFIGDDHVAGGAGIYDMPNTLAYIQFTQEQFDAYFDKHPDIKYIQGGGFHGGGWNHRLFRIEKC